MKRIIAHVLLIGVLASLSSARASVPVDLEILVEHAPLVAAGDCTAVDTAWNADGTLITTTATFRVSQVFKGSLSNRSVVVEQLGGTVGNITQALVGGPQFRVGERSLLFLAPSPAGDTFRIFGLEQGKHRIVRDPASGQDRVLLTAGVRFREPDRRGASPPSMDATVVRPGSFPLGAVIEAIAPRREGER